MKYIKIFRPINLLLVILLQSLFWYSVIRTPFGEKNLVFEFFGASEFFWVLLTSIFITISGNLINDYIDYENDALNGKGRGVSKKILLILIILFSILSLFSGLMSAKSIGSYSLGIVYLVIYGLLYFYSKVFQKRVLIGNIIVSLLTAMLIGILWFAMYFHLQPLILRPDMIVDKFFYISKFAAFYMVFSFWLSWIREIIKDVEDRVGDKSSAYQTFVIRYGLKKTKLLLNILSGIFVVFLVLAVQYLLNEQLFMLSISFLLILVAFALFHLKLNKAEKKADFHKLSLWIKGIMLLGVLTLLLI